MLDTCDPIELTSDVIDRGYKSCRNAVKKYFKGYLWPVSNIAGDQRKALDAILCNMMRTIDLLDLDSVDGLSLDVWNEVRDELSDAFRDRCSSVEVAALVDTTRRFGIPKEFLFDPLRGADHWIRNHKFETFEELDSFCSFVGGSSLASAMPVLGVIKPGYEVEALRCGKAVMLTQILANCINDMKQNKIFFAQEDLQECEVDVPRLKLRQPSKSFRYLVRLYVSRIEQIFMDASHLVQYLDFDGKRSLKSLLALNWKMLMKMKVEPECILSEEGVLTRSERLVLKSRHLMGMESDLPIITDSVEHH